MTSYAKNVLIWWRHHDKDQHIVIRIPTPDKTVFVLKWDPGYSRPNPGSIMPIDTTASGITVRNIITDDNDHVIYKEYPMKYTHSFVVFHCDDDIMGAIASQITSLAIVYSTVYSGADQRKHPSFASLTFVWGIHRGPVNSPHKWPVTRKMFPFDDVIMLLCCG